MGKKIEIISRCLRCIFEAVFACLVMIFLKIIFIQQQVVWSDIAVVIAAFVLSYLIREWTYSYFASACVHTALGVICWLLPVATSGKVIVIFMIFLYMLPTSFAYARRHYVLKNIEGAPWPVVLCAFIVYLYGVAVKSTLLLNASYITIILMLALHMIMMYLQGLRTYMKQNSDMTELPVQNIVALNTRVICIVVVGMVILMVCGRYINIDEAIVTAGNILLDGLKGILIIFSLIWRIFMKLFAGDRISTEDTSVAEGVESLEISETAGEAIDLIWKCMAVVIICFIVVKLIKKISKALFVNRIYDGDIVEKAHKTIDNDTKKEKISKEKKTVMSKYMKARKTYKKTVLVHAEDIKLNDYVTSSDICMEINEKAVGEPAEITSVYEDIRYGNREVTKDVLKKLNQLYKREKDIRRKGVTEKYGK
jgi:hypothetical protein